MILMGVSEMALPLEIIMKIKLINVNFKGKAPGEIVEATKAEAKYLIKSSNAEEVKPKKESE